MNKENNQFTPGFYFLLLLSVIVAATAFYYKRKANEARLLVDKTSELYIKDNTATLPETKMSKNTEIYYPPQNPNIPEPQTPKKSFGEILGAELKERDEFMVRNRLRLKFPVLASYKTSKGSEYEKLRIYGSSGNYIAEIYVFSNNKLEPAITKLKEITKVDSENLREFTIEKEKKDFKILESVEFDALGKQYFAVFMIHPVTQRIVVSVFASKKYVRETELLMNALFQQLTPI